MIDPVKTGFTDAQISIHGRELIDLYLFLKASDFEPGSTLDKVQRRIEQLLYNHLSIDEIEKLHQMKK